MKKERVLISVMLVVFMFVAAFSLLLGEAGDAGTYKTELEKAEKYCNDGLYQLSLESYEKVLELSESADVREKYIETYEKAYNDSVVEFKAYYNALNSSITKYPKSSVFYLKAANLELSRGKYNEAFSTCSKAVKNGANDKNIDAVLESLKYSYRLEKRIYDKYAYSTAGDVSLLVNNNYGVFSSDGEELYGFEYSYMSPISSTGEVLAVNSTRSVVYNSQNVIVSFFDEKFESVKACSDGMVPFETSDGTWNFFDCESKKVILSGYEDVSSFQKGVATVKNGGVWQLVGKDGKPVSDIKFSDVKLFDNGEFLYKDIFVAAVNGSYGIYDRSGKEVAQIGATDADCYYGGYIAYCDKNGKWGFVNHKGETVIEPQYDSARSFSNGLAGVCDGEKWGFIDKEGRLSIGYTFNYVSYFSRAKRCIVSDVDDNYYFIVLRF